jgi:hypothetical protein
MLRNVFSSPLERGGRRPGCVFEVIPQHTPRTAKVSLLQNPSASIPSQRGEGVDFIPTLRGDG